MPNTNCLEGISCPQCGSLEPFYVDIATTVEMTDNGWSLTRPGVDEMWTGGIQCVSCDHAGTLEEFRAGSAICHDCERTDGTHAETCPEAAANLPEPSLDDSVKCCPDCDGELCQKCWSARVRFAEHSGGK